MKQKRKTGWAEVGFIFSMVTPDSSLVLHLPWVPDLIELRHKMKNANLKTCIFSMCLQIRIQFTLPTCQFSLHDRSSIISFTLIIFNKLFLGMQKTVLDLKCYCKTDLYIFCCQQCQRPLLSAACVMDNKWIRNDTTFCLFHLVIQRSTKT